MDEKKVLTDTLKQIDKPIKEWSWFELVILLPIFAAGIALFSTNAIGLKELLILGGTFIAGAITTALSIYRESVKRWGLVRRYIDVERIHARLRDLGA